MVKLVLLPNIYKGETKEIALNPEYVHSVTEFTQEKDVEGDWSFVNTNRMSYVVPLSVAEVTHKINGDITLDYDEFLKGEINNRATILPENTKIDWIATPERDENSRKEAMEFLNDVSRDVVSNKELNNKSDEGRQE